MAMPAVPDARRFALANATLPRALLAAAPPGQGELLRADVVIADGRIEAILPAGAARGMPVADLDSGMVWPTFVDMHTHLDKGHIWPRRQNPDGSFPGALEAVRADRERHWSAADVARRMDFAIRCAFAHGTSLVRTHLDSIAPQHRVSWPVFAEARERWAGRVDLQAVALVPIDRMVMPEFDDLAAMVAAHDGVLGAVTYMVPELDAGLDRLLRTAADLGVDVDFHVDETRDPAARSLRAIADAALRLDFPGRIVVGHCCSLARQDAAEADETLDRVAEAGVAVVSLPMCNMYLQDREPGRTPRWRGVTLLHEMAARGIPVAVASDNTRDPFYAYGDLDAVEVFREAVRILHLDHPVGAWPRAVTTTPADILRRPDHGRIAIGGRADLVLFRARSWSEFLSRPQHDRVVLRDGRTIATEPPDYRELDDLFAAAPEAAAGRRELAGAAP